MEELPVRRLVIASRKLFQATSADKRVYLPS